MLQTDFHPPDPHAVGRPPREGRGTSAAIVLGGALLLAGVSSLVWACSEGSLSILHVFVYVAALVPGLPLGFALFGRRHAAGWIAGALMGYAVTAVVAAAVIRIGAGTSLGFAAGWCLATAAAAALLPLARPPLVRLPSWSRRDTAALLLVLTLVPALMWLPYARNGAVDGDGTRHYRAYFTADFVWHMAVVNEIGRLTLPPRDPFFADRTLHYYWSYFVVPAAGSAVLGGSARTVEQCLEINAVLSGLLFVSVMFLSVWSAVPRALASALATALGLLAASVQGWWGIYRLYARGQPLSGLRDMNIGALTAWVLQGLRIDGLPRSLWWTPQHGTACGLGLIGVVVATVPPESISTAGVLITGLALGGSVMFSPLLGGAFCLIYGLTVCIRAIRNPGTFVPVVSRHAAAAVPVVMALAWCVVNQMFEGTGSTVAFGFAGLARHAPVATLWLTLGPLLVAAAVGLLWMPPSALPQAVGVGVGLLVLYEVRLLTDDAWAGFRAGQILQLTLPALAAAAVARAQRAGRMVRAAGAVCLAALFAAGLPTTLIDVHNAQDTDNRQMGPGFRWTIDITPAEQEALDWIQGATPGTAVVQMDPTSRGRDTWSFIPSFAARRMAAGNAIALIEDPPHLSLIPRVSAIYGAEDGDEAWRMARELGIDYLYVGRAEREAHSGVNERLAGSGQFLPVFRNADAVIYAVGR
jgi:hypothetical protein